MMINYVPQRLFLAALFFFPVNFSLGASLRISDLLVLGAFAALMTQWYRVRFNMVLLLLTSICLTTISLATVLSYGFIVDTERLIFFYKYLFIFMVVVLCCNTFDKPALQRSALKVLFFTFAVLSLWVYAYFFLNLNGIIIGNLRPSFPLSNDYTESDAHLYSSVLGFILVAYLTLIRPRLGHGAIKAAIVFIVSLGALFLTGSRGGLLLFLLGMMSYGAVMLILATRRFEIRFSPLVLIVPFVLGGAVIAVLPLLQIDFAERFMGVMTLIDRALNFDIASDESSISRIVKLHMAFDDLRESYFLGAGPFEASVDWFDSLIAVLLAHGGILLVLSVLFALFYLATRAFFEQGHGRNVNSMQLLFFILLGLYIVANIITEYVLVTRSALPSIVIISLTYFLIRPENKVEEQGVLCADHGR